LARSSIKTGSSEELGGPERAADFLTCNGSGL
jgi:hypothetical protein